MTVVVGIRDGGRVLLAADAESQRGYVRVETARPKVFRVGPFAFGVSGPPAVNQAIHYRLAASLPPIVNDEDAATFAATELRDAIIAALEAARLVRAQDGAIRLGPDEDGPCLLVAFGPHLFAMDRDTSIEAARDAYLAIGAGDEVAYGALAATEDLGWSAQRRANAAIWAANRHAVGCGGRVSMIWTEPPPPAPGREDGGLVAELFRVAQAFQEVQEGAAQGKTTFGVETKPEGEP